MCCAKKFMEFLKNVSLKYEHSIQEMTNCFANHWTTIILNSIKPSIAVCVRYIFLFYVMVFGYFNYRGSIFKVMLPATRCDYMMHKNGPRHRNNLPQIELRLEEEVENLIELDMRLSDEVFKRKKTSRWEMNSNDAQPTSDMNDPFRPHKRKVATPPKERIVIHNPWLRTILTAADQKNNRFERKLKRKIHI